MHREEWLLIEWPTGESEATKYWLSTLPADTKLVDLVKLAKHRWIIERDYEELKQELGLGHYEGRGWRGFHHHGTLCIAAYGFLVAERSRFSPRLEPINWTAPRKFRPTSGLAARRVRAERHNPYSIATLRIRLARFVYDTVVLERCNSKISRMRTFAAHWPAIGQQFFHLAQIKSETSPVASVVSPAVAIW